VMQRTFGHYVGYRLVIFEGRHIAGPPAAQR
jgi:hypothetical protein